MNSGMSWYILMYFGHWPVASGLWRCLPKTMLATSLATSLAWFERGAASRRRLAEDTAGYSRIPQDTSQCGRTQDSGQE